MTERGNAVLKVLDTGFGAMLQDRGRSGWRRWGVPASGPMDRHSAACANRLLENQTGSAVIELFSQRAKFEVLTEIWVTLCGAELEASIPTWRAHLAHPGEVLTIKQCSSGMWSYLAVEGGFAAETIFGSASYYARAGLGAKLDIGTVLHRQNSAHFQLGRAVASRIATWSDRRDFKEPPRIRVYAGPQWKSFSQDDRERFLSRGWTISAQSDRVGYRLNGPELKPQPVEILSEPVRLGSIQVPESGQPIVTMPDGPTVGGYPKIALVDEPDLAWLAQCRPGQSIRFQLVS